ncbi:CAP domain-containing protein [Sphingomonas sp. MMS12-HWE2-04]|uniref:CAP domain-containing protein n=1 Tax=Sphingomonas sp. MMS12-HWE2-04 TaxID=3234199 RepID=UPI00384B5AB8
MVFKRMAAAALGACWLLITAASPASPLEADVLARINQARQHPREYAEQLRDYRRYFEGRIVYLPGDRNGVITHEGVAAVDEAIDFLERQAPLPPLDPGSLLALAAQDHADAQGDLGATGHVSAAGASPGERVRARGGDVYVGEGISYGFDDADAVVRQLIVDDGVRSRGHRTLLFDNGFHFAGVGCGNHRRFRYMCVVDFAGTEDGGPVLPEWARAKGGYVIRKPTVVAGR